MIQIRVCFPFLHNQGLFDHIPSLLLTGLLLLDLQGLLAPLLYLLDLDILRLLRSAAGSISFVDHFKVPAPKVLLGDVLLEIVDDSLDISQFL